MRFPGSKLRSLLTRGQFDASGAAFAAIRLDGGWSAIAYLGGHPRVCDWPQEALSADPWRVALQALNRDLEQPPADALLKSSPSRRVSQSRITLPDLPPLAVICKDGFPATWHQRLAGRIAGPKEWREFWTGHRLVHLGLPTPLPLACLWQYHGLTAIRCRIITRQLPNALPIDRMVRKLVAAQARHGRGRNRALDGLAVSVGGLLKTLANEGLYHRDLKASNLLVCESEGGLQPWLIDLDGLAGERHPQRPALRRSIARLAVALQEAAELPTTTLLRTLRQFAGPQRWRQEWRILQDEVQSLTAKRTRRRRNAAAYE